MDEIQIDSHLSLVPPNPDQAKVLFEIVRANKEHLAPWMRWIPHINHPDDTASFLQDAQTNNLARKGLIFLIKFDQNIVGTVSLDEVNTDNLSAALGYWITAVSQSKGIATKSAKVLIDCGFVNLGLNKIVARCAVENIRSAHVIARLGFTLEGTLRQNERVGNQFYDQLIYSMLRLDWKNCTGQALPDTFFRELS